MNRLPEFTPMRLAVLAGVVALAAVIYLDLHEIRLWIGERFDPRRMQTQDWVFWVVGLQFIGGALWTFVQPNTEFKWRWTAVLVVGALMVFAEAADYVPLKEGACQIIHGSLNPVGAGTCYRRGPDAAPLKA